MRLTSIEQVNNSNCIIVLYPSGASGEFLAGSIAKTFPGVHSSQLNEYVTVNRYTYFDLFDRVLNSSISAVTQEQVLAGVNNYFSTNYCDLKHVGLAHTTSNNLMFIKQNLPNAKIVEITTYDLISKNFRYLAAESKIPKHQNFTAGERNSFLTNAMQYTESHILSDNKLTIEWLDLLTRSHCALDQLEDFFDLECDRDAFIRCIQEYIQRNNTIIEQCGITPALLN